VSTNRTPLVYLGAGKPIGAGGAAVLGAEGRDQLVLLVHEPIESGVIVGQVLETPLSTPFLGRAWASAQNPMRDTPRR
jgi:hypothetical protein